MYAAKVVEVDDTKACEICDKAFAKYSCPKCCVKYCSLLCYQSENHRECSEEFYKNNVLEHMSLNEDEESKKKMLEILERNHQQNNDLSDDGLDSDDDDDVTDLTERLTGVDLDNADQVWDKLTEDEQQDFLAFLKSEDVSKLIPSWEPWWLFTSKKVEDYEAVNDFKKQCPEITKITDFVQIQGQQPSSCVRYNLVNILAAYAFTARYFNGEHFEFVREAVSYITTLSLCLKKNQNFENFETAVKSVELECADSEWINADSENFTVMREDLAKILKGPNPREPKFYILCALSDFYQLLKLSTFQKKERNKAASKIFGGDHFPEVRLESKAKLKSCMKKIEYYLSFTKDVYLT